MRTPEIALLVSSYERSFHLKRALLSIQFQQGVQGKMEVLVTDDGSTDETPEVVEAFAREVDFPVRMTTHPNHGFHLARSRNEGVAASTAPYLLFTDGDCLLPPDHVAAHLEYRRRGTVIVGDCYRFGKAASEQVTESAIGSAEYLRWVPWRERVRIANKAFRARIYSLLRHPMRPRLTGCNIGMWRDDCERVNGFDENYVGWGLEDRDLQLRLSRLGLHFKSILGHTVAYHLWHPPHPTFVRNNVGTANLRYYRRPCVLTRCRNGLVRRRLEDLAIRVVGGCSQRKALWEGLSTKSTDRPDVEILFLPGEGRFSSRADCNIAVVWDGCAIPATVLRKAHLVVVKQSPPPNAGAPALQPDELAQALGNLEREAA